MSPAESKLVDLRRKEYELRLVVGRLRREVYQQIDPSASPALLEELNKAEQQLQVVEQERSSVQAQDQSSGLILDTTNAQTSRGLGTTGLEAKVHLNMAHVPTSICHLLDLNDHPLITCEVTAARTSVGQAKRRVRVISYIEGYSAHAVDTFEVPVGMTHTFRQLPTLFQDRIQAVNELTRATLNVSVEDLDGKVEVHQTEPIWLLARTCAPLAVMDPQSGRWLDLTRYCGAFVTPNAPSLMTFLRQAARQHPDGRLVGYQGSQEAIPLQVKALFDALKAAEITYVNSMIDFNPQQGFASQRVRLPRESLADKEANCIDGTVLFASLLEGISMSPAFVLVPGHAFVAWETWAASNAWHFLETTMIGTNTFEQACASAEKTAGFYTRSEQLTMWPLRDLRSKYGITPME